MVLLAIGLVGLVAACASPIGVTRWSMEEAYQQSYGNALSADHPTAFSIQVLLRLNLYERFADDPAAESRRDPSSARRFA